MKNKEIKAALDEMARNKVKEVDLWPRIEMHARHSKGRSLPSISGQREWMPASDSSKRAPIRLRLLNFGLAGLTGILLVMFIGMALWLRLPSATEGNTELVAGASPSAISASPALPTALAARVIAEPQLPWRNRDRTQHIYGLGAPIGISRTVGPYRFTLEKGYADSSIIMLAYSVQVERGSRLPNLRHDTLSRKDDSATHQDIYSDFATISEVSGPSGVLETAKYTYVSVFDAEDFGSLDENTSMSFVIAVARESLPESLSDVLNDTTQPGLPGAKELDRKGLVPVALFEFPLSRSGPPEVVVEKDQHVDTSDVSVTLQRVAAMGSGVRFTLRYDSPLLTDFDIWPNITLQAGSNRIESGELIQNHTSVDQEENTRTYILLGPYSQYLPDWTLRINTMQAYARAQEPGVTPTPPLLITGPWEFAFSMSGAQDVPTEKIANVTGSRIPLTPDSVEGSPIWRGNFGHLKGLTTWLGLRKSAGHYALTLEHLYADANSIVVIFSAESEDPDAEDLFRQLAALGSEHQLTTNSGTYLGHSTYSWSVSEAASGSSGALQSARRTYLVRFDTPVTGVQADSLDLGLHLALPAPLLRKLNPGLPTGGVTALPSPRTGGAGYSPIATFEFSVPMTREETRTIPVGQSTVRSGVTVTLDRVVLTRSGARAVFAVDAPGKEKHSYTFDFWINTGRGAYVATGLANIPGTRPPLSLTQNQLEGTWEYHMFAPFSTHHGEWTLNISGIRSSEGGSNEYIPGGWEFRFTVPPGP